MSIGNGLIHVYPFNIRVLTHLRRLPIIFLVSTPTVNVTAPNTQTVGQSLTLQCEVTTVRGITSRVDIVWSSNGTIFRRINGVSSSVIDNSLVYTDSYTISQLSTTDDSRVIQCEVVININPPVTAANNVTLNATGECCLIIGKVIQIHYCSTHSSHSYSHHITIWFHTRSYSE